MSTSCNTTRCWQNIPLYIIRESALHPNGVRDEAVNEWERMKEQGHGSKNRRVKGVRTLTSDGKNKEMCVYGKNKKKYKKQRKWRWRTRTREKCNSLCFPSIPRQFRYGMTSLSPRLRRQWMRHYIIFLVFLHHENRQQNRKNKEGRNREWMSLTHEVNGRWWWKGEGKTFCKNSSGKEWSIYL